MGKAVWMRDTFLPGSPNGKSECTALDEAALRRTTQRLLDMTTLIVSNFVEIYIVGTLQLGRQLGRVEAEDVHMGRGGMQHAS
jgi:hypothetical protein